ncbi:glycosyltransferase family 4 protein [Bradyrhizobium sp. IC3123]|uniref:glycosyltransferase family 4 protein n=1 Tax=Bradyrhizobium sp. IC3123 TaxID=2793803 RepID=UPI001CD6BF34|nr:glycosyltransferase family 4 protein [Bradyrhizobium sp. IC3123]MCA1392244.1 glycosyltransferase family 4 protein [Bradyrhizobium sp. IC3123]
MKEFSARARMPHMSSLEPAAEAKRINVAMLLSCSSFEGFFGWVQGQTRASYLERYRNDWAWYYARGLSRNGIRPMLYIPSLRESGKFATDDGIDVRFLPLENWYQLIERVWVKRLSRRSRWSLYAEERLNTIAFMRPLRKALAADRIDLLYVQEYWSGRFDHLAGRIDLPIVGADHGGLPDRVVKLFKRDSFCRAALLYGQTEQECRIVSRYGGRSRLQPNGCDVSEFFPDAAASRSKTILTITRLTNRQKRTTDLIRALANLPEEWTLDIVGTGPDKDLMQGLAAKLGVSHRVRFHGFVDRSKVRSLLCRCGVYVMPSANEAVALAVLEAMACGAAVVLSRIRSFEQLVTHGVNGVLFPVGDVTGLSAAILDAWRNHQALGRAAIETVHQSYNAEKLYAELADSLRRSAHHAVATAAESSLNLEALS